MTSAADREDRDNRMPRGLKWAAAAAVIVMSAGALLLLTARGEAMLIDLYAAAQQMLCF